MASLCSSTDVASIVWQNVESAQLINTVPTNSTTPAQTGLEAELENIEARNETYAMTRGFLKLLDVLTNASIPHGLGAGTRYEDWI